MTLTSILIFLFQKYRSNAIPAEEETVDPVISDFDKLVNNTNDESQTSLIVTPVAPPKKAVKKKPVRASLPMKFKVTKVIFDDYLAWTEHSGD